MQGVPVNTFRAYATSGAGGGPARTEFGPVRPRLGAALADLHQIVSGAPGAVWDSACVVWTHPTGKATLHGPLSGLVPATSSS
jgi:hypothetical protein